MFSRKERIYKMMMKNSRSKKNMFECNSSNYRRNNRGCCYSSIPTTSFLSASAPHRNPLKTGTDISNDHHGILLGRLAVTGSSFERPPSPFSRSPWHAQSSAPLLAASADCYSYTCPMGSLVCEEGHIYSLTASGDLLYTGSDSKNIRVWKNQKEFTGFKSNNELVKATIIAGERICTSSADGRVKVWRKTLVKDGL